MIGEEEEILLENELINLCNAVNPVRKVYTKLPQTDYMMKWDNQEFIRRFRISKQSALDILEQIRDHLTHRSCRNNPVPPLQQLLLTLRFLATGSFYITIADDGGIHKSTLGKIIKNVIYAIAGLRQHYVHFPNTPEGREKSIIAFHRIARSPQVIGAIDCTHVKIQSPGGDIAENFRNRKGYFSLNVQVVCDEQNYILDIVTHWPGASHDSYIFNNSLIKMNFEVGEIGNVFLLGDSGYLLRKFLITPLANPNTPAEQLYNEAHIRTRNVIERTFGIWKRRFPMLSLGIRTRLPLTQAIIVATAILHNVACKNRDEVPNMDVAEAEAVNIVVPANLVQDDNAGTTVRAALIQYVQELL